MRSKKFQWLLALVLSVPVVAIGQASSDCPKLEVIGPSGITNPGERMTFVLQLGASEVFPKEIRWEVNQGEIVFGQGTLSIDVISKLEGTTVTATATVLGLPTGCPTSAFELAGVMQRLPLEMVDEWGELPNDDQRGRLDLFFAELSNNPHHKGVFFIYTKNKATERRRLRLVLDHARFRKFDRSVLIFCLEKSSQNGTKVYRIPPQRMSEIQEWGCNPIPGALLR